VFKKNEQKDERAIVIERAGHSLALKIVGFALLVDVFFRAVVQETAAWDLLGIVILGGLVASVYQAMHRVAGKYWIKAIVLSVLGAALAAAAGILLVRNI
jgi:hypothetical protein